MITRVRAHYVESVASIVTLAVYGLFGNLAAMIFPIIVGTLMDAGLTSQQIGTAESAEMAGIAVGGILWSRLILRVDWRVAVAFAVPVAVAGNVICALLPAFAPVVAGRLVAGLGSGVLAALASAGLAQTRRPDRTFGLTSTMNMVLSAALVYVFTFISHGRGAVAVFSGMAVLLAALFVAVRLVPSGSPEGRADAARAAVAARSAGAAVTTPPVPWLSGALALAGIWAYFVAALVFCTYLERIAVAAGFSTEFTARTLGIGQLAGAAGALLTAVIASFMRRRILPMIGYVALAAGGSFVLTGTPHPWPYAIAVCALFFSWSGIYPYFMGTVATLDPTARLVSLTITVSFLGKAMAPLVAGYLARGGDYTLSYVFSTVGFLVCIGLLAVPVMRTDRRARESETPRELGSALAPVTD